jgi:hypothetical protein
MPVVMKIDHANQHRTHGVELIKVMEQQNPSAESVRPNLEAGTVGGEWVLAYRPDPVRQGAREWIISMVPEIEDHLKKPSVLGRHRPLGSQRNGVSVEDALQITLRKAGRPENAVMLIDGTRIQISPTVAFVPVDHGVAVPVVLRFHQPGEDVIGLFRI